MSEDANKLSMRIDWFDGSVVTITANENSPSSTQLAIEESPKAEINVSLARTENKPIGFKRLHEMSLMSGPILALEISNRPGFWYLFKQKELKSDFIVLIVKIIANVYKSTQPVSNSKLIIKLKNYLINSDFLEKLTLYIRSLPDVKIVDKRMNAQLWDDVEGFFNNVLNMCEGIFNTIEYINDTDEMIDKRLTQLLEELHVSALGVMNEHSERFSDELFKTIADFEHKLQEKNSVTVKNDSWEDISHSEAGLTTEDPHNYRNLSIFPTMYDLITPDIVTEPNAVGVAFNDLTADKNIIIKPNIVAGAYSDVDHYIDVQFKLLREDYLGPLRKGICEYLKNPSKKRYENIRVHPKVRVLHTYVSNNKVGHLIDIAWGERATGNGVKNKQFFKQLMFGSLLLFTSDKFRTILCATVLDSSVELLRNGFLAVSFQNPVSKNIVSEPYLMVESEVFFEPYHQVLKVLKESDYGHRNHRLPMERYIVDVKTQTKPPDYLTHETIYTVEAFDKSEIAFEVLDTDHWPKEELGLDLSQLEAYKFALTKEFTVIQGPPGTGKTFIGIKIASTILKNLSLEGTPMLVICYTNHALDQFLEGILNITSSVIRLGSQSKSKKLEPYNLNNVRSKIKCKYSYLYAKKRGELERIYDEMTDLQTDIEKCEEGILCYRCLKPYLKIDEQEYKLKYSEEDRVLNWLFEHLEDSHSSQTHKFDVKEDALDKLEETDSENCKIITCFTEKWALNEVESLQKMIKEIEENTEVFTNPEAIQKLQREILKINKRLKCYKNNLTTCNQKEITNKIDKVDDLYMLNAEQRWQIYFDAVRHLKYRLLSVMDALLEKHNKANIELEEISTLIDGEVIRTARVVGVTTTAAARRHRLIVDMKSPIVIVEEAAEVLEAHIVASLTPECQHLILIGDHKQLRPTAANYKLTREYNLDISLFERMIRNGIHARTLTTQRRMRPDFANLLVPVIYDRLDNHTTVLNYPHVKGLKKDLQFFDHQVFEDSEGMEDSWSHKNTFEAEWCVALAKYLLHVGYLPEHITILATYNGQVSLIKKLSQEIESLRDVKITAVDNFQGEENRIVILSLVRSNRDGNIGFLSASNRICVALSRAKEGFYIFGNMSILKSASPIWKAIYEKLIALDAIGDVMSLARNGCEGFLEVKTAKELREINFYA